MGAAFGQVPDAGKIRVAVAQTAPQRGAKASNLDDVVARLGEAATHGAGHLRNPLVCRPRTDLYGPLVNHELWPQTARRGREADLTA